MVEVDKASKRQEEPLTPICAIGASAGGVRALQQLFEHVDDKVGLAYVVIIHLSPDHESQLSEILNGRTKMPAIQVGDTPKLKPNCVDVIAPDRELVIDGHSINSRPFTKPRGQRAPIDMFFRSVVSGRDDFSVVLSRAGSDCAAGVPVSSEKRTGRQALVLFIDAGRSSAEEAVRPVSGDASDHDRVRQIEEELKSTQERLSASPASRKDRSRS